MSLAYDSRRVPDAICTRVGEKISPLYVKWSIGRRKDVVAEIVNQLHLFTDVIEKDVSSFIKEGFLTDNPHIAAESKNPEESRLGITHQGWLRWS
jgi:hypothetical protein